MMGIVSELHAVGDEVSGYEAESRGGRALGERIRNRGGTHYQPLGVVLRERFNGQVRYRPDPVIAAVRIGVSAAYGDHGVERSGLLGVETRRTHLYRGFFPVSTSVIAHGGIRCNPAIDFHFSLSVSQVASPCTVQCHSSARTPQALSEAHISKASVLVACLCCCNRWSPEMQNRSQALRRPWKPVFAFLVLTSASCASHCGLFNYCDIPKTWPLSDTFTVRTVNGEVCVSGTRSSSCATKGFYRSGAQRVDVLRYSDEDEDSTRELIASLTVQGAAGDEFTASCFRYNGNRVLGLTEIRIGVEIRDRRGRIVAKHPRQPVTKRESFFYGC